MGQLICLLSCDSCGNTEEVYIPLTQHIVLNQEIIYKMCQSEHRGWSYDDEADEWMCKDCSHKPFTFKISEQTIKQFHANVSKETWAWENLVRGEVAEQMGIDSDSVKASEVSVKAYMDPHSMAVDFHITPVGLSWLDIKKRHPSKELKNSGALMGDEK